MNGKTLAITGALTLGLLAPAGTAIAATTDDDNPGLGGLLGIFDRDDDDNDRSDRKERRERRNAGTFRLNGDLRSVDRDDREITVDLGNRNRTVKVAKDAKIWRDGDRVRLRNLERGDEVRVSGEKRNGRWVAERIVAED